MATNDTEILVIPHDSDRLALCAIITVAIQMSFYLVACIGRFDKVTDFAGGTNVVILAVVTFGLGGLYSPRQILLTVLVTCWGLRISGYLLIRILVIGVDKRFDGIRENSVKFFVFWIIQMIWVFLLGLPVIFVNSPRAPNKAIGPADVIGAIIFGAGLLFEAVSDHIKFTYKLRNKNGWCAVGPWRISRHPNYFGEISLWWGTFVVTASILEGPKWIVIITPIAVTFIILFVSGIPMLERSSDRKYGHDPDYVAYKQSTPILVPFIPYLYQRIPRWFKVAFCCEFPFYSVPPNQKDADTGNEAATIIKQPKSPNP